jgi:hypothetical protein
MAVSPPVMSWPNYKISTLNCFFVVYNLLLTFLLLLHISCNWKSSLVVCSSVVCSEGIHGTGSWGSFYNQPTFFKSLCFELPRGIKVCTGVMFYNFSPSHTLNKVCVCQIFGTSTAGNNEGAINCTSVFAK